MNPRNLAVPVAVVGFLYASSAFACTKDTDCKGDRICVERVCTAPSPPSAPATPGASSPAAATPTLLEDSESRTSFHANLLGLLQFGLTPTIEMGDTKTLLLRARLLNTGPLPYLLAAENGDVFGFGLALGAQGRTYVGGLAQQGPYFGAGIELMYSSSNSDDSAAVEYTTTSVIPQFETGIRWDYPDYLLGVGAFLGAAIPIATTGYDLEESETLMAYGLIVDMGWYL